MNDGHREGTAPPAARPVVHVGYPKAASSSLQGLLFARHPQVAFLSHHVRAEDASPVQADPRTKAFHEALYLTPDDAGAVSAARDLWESHLRPHAERAAADGLRVVYGCEDFCNSVRTDVLANPARLAAVLGPAKVVMVVRDQHEIVRSLYEMLPYAPFLEDRGGRTLSFPRWLDACLGRFDDSFLAGLRYDRVAAAYRAQFGADNVLVLPFETLTGGGADGGPAGGVRRLCEFVGVDAAAGEELFRSAGRMNSAAQYRVHNLRRRLLPGKTVTSRFLPAAVRGPLVALATRLLGGRKAAFPDAYRAEFERLYGDGNRALAADGVLDASDDSVRRYPGLGGGA